MDYKSIVVVLAALSLACSHDLPQRAAEQPPSWVLRAVGAPEAWAVTRGDNVTIAIIDSGLDTSRLTGLTPRILGPIDLVPGRGGAGQDSVGHGTAVASIVAGSGDLDIWGVTPLSRVLPISVTTTSAPIDPRLVAEAILAAISAHASIINLSIGRASDDPAIRAAVDAAARAGVVIVAASGDAGAQAPFFPANITGEAVPVRALDERGKPTLRSNAVGADGIDAPGVNVPAVVLDRGVARVGWLSGSSAATAVVSGAIALLISCVIRLDHPAPRLSALVAALQGSAVGSRWFNIPRAMALIGC